MIKLLFLEASLGVGGAERNNQRVLTGLDKGRYDVRVATLKGMAAIGEEMVAEGIPITENLAPGKFRFGAAARALNALVGQFQPDLLFTSDSPQPMYWGGRLKRQGLVPRYVVVFHTTGFSDKGFQRRAAWRSAVPVADRIIATGASHVEYVHHRVGVPREKIVNILNGVNLERFTPPQDKTPFKASLGYSGEELLVGIVAALRPEKNHLMLVETAARLSRQFPSARFLLVGDGVERPRIEQQISQRGLGDQVKLLGRRSDIPEILAALDLIVLCSRPIIETLPVCLVESDAMGLPAVSTRVGSVDDIVEDGVTGYLVPPGDVDGFTDRIGQLLADAHLRREFGAAARERALRLFRIDDMVRNYDRLFTEIVEKK